MTDSSSNLLESDLIDDIAGSLVNPQDSALLLATVFGFTREEITNLTDYAIKEEGIVLVDGGSTRIFNYNEMTEKFCLAKLLRFAHKDTKWYSCNGEGGTQHNLIDNGHKVFKEIEGITATLDERLKAIGELHSLEDLFTYDNLRESGKQFGAY